MIRDGKPPKTKKKDPTLVITDKRKSLQTSNNKKLVIKKDGASGSARGEPKKTPSMIIKDNKKTTSEKNLPKTKDTVIPTKKIVGAKGKITDNVAGQKKDSKLGKPNLGQNKTLSKVSTSIINLDTSSIGSSTLDTGCNVTTVADSLISNLDSKLDPLETADLGSCDINGEESTPSKNFGDNDSGLVEEIFLDTPGLDLAGVSEMPDSQGENEEIGSEVSLDQPADSESVRESLIGSTKEF